MLHTGEKTGEVAYRTVFLRGYLKDLLACESLGCHDALRLFKTAPAILWMTPAASAQLRGSIFWGPPPQKRKRRMVVLLVSLKPPTKIMPSENESQFMAVRAGDAVADFGLGCPKRLRTVPWTRTLSFRGATNSSIWILVRIQLLIKTFRSSELRCIS